MTTMDTTQSSQVRTPQPQGQKPIKTGTWLPAEDERLREAVARHGARWVIVASDVGSRNGDQCAKRWNENLNPKLDHSAWSLEEEQNLLSYVNLYGHNWKFIADSFFETRAPLALKNRYSLLKRRSRRQGSRQHSRQRATSGRSELPQFDPYWYPSSGTVTPSRDSAIDLTALSTDDQTVNMQMPAYGPMDFIQSTASGPCTAGTALPASEDQNLVWSHSPFESTTNNPSAGPFGSAGAVGSDTQMGGFGMFPETYTSNPWPKSGRKQADMSRSASQEKIDGEVGSEGTEYSVTCRRGSLRTVVNHLVDAAMSENAEGSEKDDPVTLKLRLKV